ncbi:MAG TPA: hypothetical protein VM118_09825, partial [Acidobacteriota bacterium]|nr:hypothetical protein [Acidobacteriota bacterium]
MTSFGPHTEPCAEIIGVISARGGAGQSTVCQHWAQAVGNGSGRCLLVEMAGGDLAAAVGATPKRFVEDVAEGSVPAAEAATAIGGGTDLLAAGTGWSVFGPPNDAIQHRLVENLSAGPWTVWVIDLCRSRPHRHHPIWSICRTLAVVLEDDVASVTRNYVLVRHLLACGWGGRLGLVLNRMTDGRHAERLRRHFDQITQAFLHLTVPVIGVVPSGDADRRAVAVRQ